MGCDVSHGSGHQLDHHTFTCGIATATLSRLLIVLSLLYLVVLLSLVSQFSCFSCLPILLTLDSLVSRPSLVSQS